MAKTKVLGWGKCSAVCFDYIVENSCQLSVEEGQEQEATIEGGSARLPQKPSKSEGEKTSASLSKVSMLSRCQSPRSMLSTTD